MWARCPRMLSAILRFLLPMAAAVVLSGDTPEAQDTGVNLTIRFAGNAARFRVGEIITIELSFSSSSVDTYEMDTRMYDRSGRLDEEQFHVMPEGRDPLHDYFMGGLYCGFPGGGLSGGPKLLTRTPEMIREELNEWVALDKPGHYSLYVTSTRVSRHAEPRDENVQLRSDRIEFDVVEPESGWQDQRLASAMATLSDPSSTQERKTAAARTLRFLDTPRSIHELVRQIVKPGDDQKSDFEFGLMGSRHQELVLQELESQLAAPDAGITASFLRILAQTKFLLSHEAFPPYPETNTAEQKTWQPRFEGRTREFCDLQDKLYRKTELLVPVKEGAARAETIRTLLQRPARSPADAESHSAIPGPDLAFTLLSLTPDEQYTLLSSFWARLSVPTIIPALEKLLDQPVIKHQLLRDILFQRLYELNPGKAVPRILAEIRQPHIDGGMFTVNANTLAVLPDVTLPQFDELLAKRVADPNSRTRELDAGLIGRYSSGAILARVKVCYESAAGAWSCAIADGFMNYFLRVDPDYGTRQVGKGASTCTPESLKTLVSIGRWAKVEPAIIAKLNDPQLCVARDAAELLAMYGGPKAKMAMFERVRLFHDQWVGREKELRFIAEMPREAHEASSFQFGLVEALGHAANWLLTDEEIGELEKLTLGQERENVARWRWHSPVTLKMTVAFNGQIHAEIGAGLFLANDLSALLTKLSQFPAGTLFRMTTYGHAGRIAIVTRAIMEVAVLHALTIENGSQ